MGVFKDKGLMIPRQILLGSHPFVEKEKIETGRNEDKWMYAKKRKNRRRTEHAKESRRINRK
jgi:hypothetical protein